MIRTIIAALLALSLAGCSGDSFLQGLSNDDSYSAKIEDAEEALDEQNYDKVISSLIDIYNTTSPDVKVSRLLGSAYMGKAGIDITEFIYSSDDEDLFAFDIVDASLILFPAPARDNQTPFESSCDIEDLSILMTTSGVRYVDGFCASDMISYLDKAKRVFYVLENKNKMTDDCYIQYGFVSAVHFAIITGKVAADNIDTLPYDSTGYEEGRVPVPLSSGAYNLYKIHAGVFGLSLNWQRLKDYNTNIHFSPSISVYREDLTNIRTAIRRFNAITSAENSVKNKLDAYLRSIINVPTGTISDEDITNMTTYGILQYINILSTAGH